MTYDRPLIIVTGASGSIGGEIVRQLIEDHDVVAVGCSAAGLARFDGLPPVTTWRLDLVDFDEVERRVATLTRIDGIVHAAAIGLPPGGLPASDAAAWREVLDINVVAPAELTRFALPALRASGGQVVFINSGAGYEARGGTGIVYAASKHALVGLANQLRVDEEEAGLRVSTVYPGPTAPGMAGSASGDGSGVERRIDPRSVAATVAHVVRSPRDAHLTDVRVRPLRELRPR